MPIGELWRLLRGLSPERRAVIEKEYAKARETVPSGEDVARTAKPSRFSAMSSRETTDSVVIMSFWSSLRIWMTS